MSTCSKQSFWPPTWKSPMTPSPSVEVVSVRIQASAETRCEFLPPKHGLRAGHREQPIAWHSLCRSKTIVLSLVHLVRNGRVGFCVSRTAWLSPGRLHLCLLSDVTWPLKRKGNNPEGRVKHVFLFGVARTVVASVFVSRSVYPWPSGCQVRSPAWVFTQWEKKMPAI